MTSSDTDSSEAALVALARAGDQAAFEALVRRRQGPVRGLLRRLSSDVALGDDLAQEVFLQAWRRLSHLRDMAAFGGWLRQIAVNVWLQHARRRQLLVEPLEDGYEDPGVGAESSLALRVDLDAALARLRAPERLCVLLAYGEGLSHGEIADATGLPLGTVKSHVSRGAARLRTWLGGDSVERRDD